MVLLGSVGLAWLQAVGWSGSALCIFLFWDQWLPKVCTSQGGWQKCKGSNQTSEVHIKLWLASHLLTLLALARLTSVGQDVRSTQSGKTAKVQGCIILLREGMKSREQYPAYHTIQLTYHSLPYKEKYSSPFFKNAHVYISEQFYYFLQQIFYLVRIFARSHLSFFYKIYFKNDICIHDKKFKKWYDRYNSENEADPCFYPLRQMLSLFSNIFCVGIITFAYIKNTKWYHTSSSVLSFFFSI